MAKLLQAAITNQRWDLAAHALVLATVQTTINEANERNNGRKKRRTARQPRRS